MHFDSHKKTTRPIFLILALPVVMGAAIIVGCDRSTSDIEPEMVLVHGGTFQMGDLFGDGRDGETVHPVTIDDFFIGETEVTVAEFRRFVEATNYVTEAEQQGTAKVYVFVNDSTRGWVDSTGISWQNPGYDQTDKHPVVAVSWKDANAYTDWLSKTWGKPYRLPTEAEWEYAARNGGKKIKYPWGNEPQDNVANFADASTPYPWAADSLNDSYKKTAPAKSFPANELGLYEMSGNVWEWVEDWHSSYPLEEQVNPAGPATGEYRVMRGGSWINGPYRNSARNWDDPTARYHNLGFRIALPVADLINIGF